MLWSDRVVKGYQFEMVVQMVLHERGIKFKGNPKKFSEWCFKGLDGCDLFVNGWRVEIKRTDKPIFMSWYLRSWKPRKADIFVASDLSNIPWEIKSDIMRDGRKIMNLYEFASFVEKHRNKGSKMPSYIKFNIMEESAKNVIRDASGAYGDADKMLAMQYLNGDSSAIAPSVKLGLYFEYQYVGLIYSQDHLAEEIDAYDIEKA